MVHRDRSAHFKDNLANHLEDRRLGFVYENEKQYAILNVLFFILVF